VLLFTVNLIGAVRLWIGNGVGLGMMSWLSGFLFIIATTYMTHVWVHISQLFHSIFQVSLLSTTFGSKDDVQAAGAAICWMAHFAFLAMVAWKLSPKRPEIEVPDMKQPKLIIVCVCFVLAFIGAVLPPNKDAGNWLVSCGVFAIVFVGACFFVFPDIHGSLLNISAGLFLAVSPAFVSAADGFRRASKVASSKKNTDGLAGYVLLTIALWLCFAVYHTPLDKMKDGVQSMFSSRTLTASSVAFLLNFLGLIFSWVYVPSGWKILGFLVSIWFFFTVIIEKEDGGFFSSRTYTCLFFTTTVLLSVMSAVAAPADPTLGQIGACMVMICHLIFIIILCMHIPSSNQAGGLADEDSAAEADFNPADAIGAGYQYDAISDATA
jgi:hypothetical protein